MTVHKPVKEKLATAEQVFPKRAHNWDNNRIFNKTLLLRPNFLLKPCNFYTNLIGKIGDL